MTVQSNKRLLSIVSGIAVLLLIPFVAMQFTTEVNWSPFDFVIAAILLFGTGLLCELVMRRVPTQKSRLVLCGLLLFVLALVWAELAVGVFGTPFAGS